MSKMKAAYLEETEKIIFKEIDRPKIDANEVLVRIKSVGICGSDMHYYKHGRIGNFVVTEPLILGHEASGVVEETGSGIRTIKPGDRVAIEPGIPCRECEFCKTGHYNLCPDVIFMATPPVDGAFTEYIVSPEDFLYPLPEEVSFAEGAMVEPLAVGMNAAGKADIQLGDKALILGAGPIGLVTLQSVRAAGASDITVTDINDLRLDKASDLGATRTVNVEQEKIPSPESYDLVIETAGVESTARQALELVKTGGRVVLVGLSPQSSFDFPVSQILGKELRIEGIFRYANLYRRALNLIASGQVDLESLITDRFPFEEVDRAFVYTDENQDRVVKVMIDF